MAKSPHQFLFRNFCSTDLFCTCTYQFLFRSPIFVPLTFLHLHLGSPSPNGRQCPTNFCSADLFALALTQFLFCNFCSADLFALALGSPSPNGRQCPPIFVLLTFLHLHCPHQFLFRHFCSAFLFRSPFCTYNCLGSPHHLATQYTMHTNILNIRNPNCSQY